MNLSTSPVDINRREAEVSKYAADKVYEIPANVSSPTPTAYAAVVQLCSACHRRRMAGCRGSMSACRKEIQLSKKYERALKLHFRMDGKVCYDNRVGVHIAHLECSHIWSYYELRFIPRIYGGFDRSSAIKSRVY